jgi:hypothetical protein
MSKTTFALCMGFTLAVLLAIAGILAYYPALTTKGALVPGWLGVLVSIAITMLAYVCGGLTQANATSEEQP